MPQVMANADTLLLTLFFFFFLTAFVCCPLSSALEEKNVDGLQIKERLLLTSAVGPESLAFDPDGYGPYTGVSNGRILMWQGPARGWTQFAVTSTQSRPSECDDFPSEMLESICGRPLGLQFHRATGDLYVADAYFGLLVVRRGGGPATQLAAEADGGPFHFTNGLDVDQETGMVYFTDSSTRFRRRDYVWAVLAGDTTGRLMSYDPQAGKLTVLMKNLAFPNGVAMSEDNTFLLFAETGTCRIMRYWLRGPKTGTSEVFADLPGYPDNVKKNPSGEFWVALNQQKLPIRNIVGNFKSMEDEERSRYQLQEQLQWPFQRPVALRLGREGGVLEMLDGAAMTSISEVEESNGSLWVGSVVMPFVGVYQV